MFTYSTYFRSQNVNLFIEDSRHFPFWESVFFSYLKVILNNLSLLIGSFSQSNNLGNTSSIADHD